MIGLRSSMLRRILKDSARRITLENANIISSRYISKQIVNPLFSNFASVKSKKTEENTHKNPQPGTKTIVKREKKEENADPIVLEYIMEKISSTNDPETLSKISLILDQIEKRELDKKQRTVSGLDTHPDVLTETDVYRTVSSLIDAPEEKLIKSMQNNLPISASIWKKNIKKRIHSIPTFQLLRLLKSVFNLQFNTIKGNSQEENGQEDFDENEAEQEDIFEDVEDVQTQKSKQQKNTKKMENDKNNSNNEQQQEQTKSNSLPAEIQEMCQSIWSSIESEFRTRLKQMSIDEIARTVKLYSHANKSNVSFFRDIENELFERDMEYVDYRCIGVILEGFSHANLGSTTLYSNLARTIKVASAEISALDIAKYAYYFSKTPENIKGGFGVYKIAEQKLTFAVELMDFSELLKVASYMIQQNIGSNMFFGQLEKRLIEAYPPKQYGGISPAQLTKLVKSTSKHYFSYNDKALFHTLEADCIKQIPYMSCQQISTILWSYSRSRRGNFELYEALEGAFIKNLKKFHPRSLAFAYYQFAYARKGSPELFKKLEEAISNLGVESFSGHYLVKILSGMNMQNTMDSLRDTMLFPILKHMRMKSATSRYSEAISFLYLLVELPPYQLETDQLDVNAEYDKLFMDFEVNKFAPVAHQLKIDEVSQLYFAYRTANIGSEEFLDTLEERLRKQTEVPKPYFARVVFALTQHLQFEMAREFIPIVKELMKYGDIKYFFSHEDFIRLSWSILLIEQANEQARQQQESLNKQKKQRGDTNNKEINEEEEEDNTGSSQSSRSDFYSPDDRYAMPGNFWLEDAYEALFAINPNTLKFTTLPLWVQSICMLTQAKMRIKKHKFQGSQRKQLMQTLIEKVDQMDQTYKQEYVKRDLQQFSQTKSEIFKALETRLGVLVDVDYQLVQDLVDEFLNVIDCAVFIKHEDVILKIGVIILNEHHYSNRQVQQSGQSEISHDNLLLSVQNKISLLQTLLDWQIIVIDQIEWNSMTEESKNQYFYENIQIDSSAQSASH